MAKKKAATGSSVISEQLRDVIAGRRLSAYSVGQAAGVNPAIVSRFVSRERGLTSDSLDKIAAALGIRLAEGRGGLR
jgi:transcriptional regulator with XRE-family HTH domain